MKQQNETKNYGFFSRMLLLCTGLLMCFSIIASIVVGHISQLYEQTQFLRNYDLAMANLSEVFYDRISSFNLFAARVLNNSQVDPDLCTLLEASSLEDVPARVRSNCISLLTGICQSDQYLKGFFLYSPSKKQLYCYTNDQSYLSAASTLPEMPELAPFGRDLVDNQTIERMFQACTSNQSDQINCYGIAATLFQHPTKPLGYLIPLYSTLEFENILKNYQVDASSEFQISNSAGHYFFQSYAFSNAPEGRSFQNTLMNSQYGFEVSYEVSRSLMHRSMITYLIVGFAIIVTLFSFGLYYLTYYLSNRNISHILEGMQHFSVSHLTHRITPPRGRNEFTQIIEGFNTMCEELQRNVERSYVYELQQKKSELYALQTSINPHFLYNTLEMVRNQIASTRTGDASQMILLLSKIYRSQTNTNMFVTLLDEVELCENLMILYQYRFQNFEYEFELAADAERYALPKNTLQPLIENYFVHGIVAERQDNLFLLTIKTEQREGTKYICMCLCNNGHPIDSKRIASIGRKLRQEIFDNQDAEGFALTNVQNRLRIAFQEDCTLLISEGSEDMSFQIELSFPALFVEQLRSEFSTS